MKLLQKELKLAKYGKNTRLPIFTDRYDLLIAAALDSFIPLVRIKYHVRWPIEDQIYRSERKHNV